MWISIHLNVHPFILKSIIHPFNRIYLIYTAIWLYVIWISICIFIQPSEYLSIHIFIWISTHQFKLIYFYPTSILSIHIIWISILHPAFHPSIHLFIHLNIHSSIQISNWITVHPSIFLNFCASEYPSIHPSYSTWTKTACSLLNMKTFYIFFYQAGLCSHTSKKFIAHSSVPQLPKPHIHKYIKVINGSTLLLLSSIYTICFSEKLQFPWQLNQNK